MAGVEDPTMQNIIDYAQSVAPPTSRPAEQDKASPEAYERQLDQTIQELQNRVSQQRAALEKFKASQSRSSFGRASEDKREKLRQLQTIKAAYDKLTPSEPSLPAPGSALPAVLALRTLQRTITGSKEAIATTRRELAARQVQLQQEQSELEDGNIISISLEERIAVLREQLAERANKDPNDLANEMVGARQARKLDFERDTLRLHDALVRFIKDQLGAMIAAEELGGAVVGDEMEIDEGDLAAGFEPGRKRKAKELDSDARQMRIDAIWGQAHGHHGEEAPSTEAEAAGQELHELIEGLIQASVVGGSLGAYVQLDRDSAAARFLVRAKVAQLHPKDARKLRLIDFGRELDD